MWGPPSSGWVFPRLQCAFSIGFSKGPSKLKRTVKRGAVSAPRDARALSVEVSHRYDAYRHGVEREVEEDEAEEDGVRRLRAVYVLHDDRTTLQHIRGRSVIMIKAPRRTLANHTYEHAEECENSFLAPVLGAQVPDVAWPLAIGGEVDGQSGLRAPGHGAAERTERAAETQRDDAEGRVGSRLHEGVLH